MKNSTKLPGKNGKTTGPAPPFNSTKKQKANNVTAKR
jgi:hypothetical protein